MLLAPVDYYRPDSVSEAIAALADHANSRVLAGGQTWPSRAFPVEFDQ